ncbi:MAG: metallophosphatase [Candidatus Pacearchaeota archaeon]
MLFFTSDTHFSHANIIKYCNRPFRDVREMNETIISNWNKVVTPQDVVYHLGDFAFGDAAEIKRLLSRLNGNIVFIKGNHDRSLYEVCKPRDVMTIREAGHVIFMSHYPHLAWDRSHHGSLHFFGHQHGASHHGSVKYQPRSMDVGVDCWKYTPISFPEILQEFKQKGEL